MEFSASASSEFALYSVDEDRVIDTQAAIQRFSGQWRFTCPVFEVIPLSQWGQLCSPTRTNVLPIRRTPMQSHKRSADGSRRQGVEWRTGDPQEDQSVADRT